MTSLAYLMSRNPLMGGEYYRALRPAGLAARDFGWQTAACSFMGTVEDDGPLSFVTLNRQVMTPEIIVIRPVREWRQHWNDQAHENGQYVIADLDDDVWSHEDYDRLTEESPDNFDEWFWGVDAVLVSTKVLATRLRERGHKAPIYVAPNCYDPFGLNATPQPGNIIGTRLWMSGRMEGDLVLYDTLIQPLLEELGLLFLHVGADAEMGRFIDRGWDEDRLIERRSVPIPLFPQACEGLSIGTICMAENAFNDVKTETHAVELAAQGIPLVAASNHPLYKRVPGRVDIDKDAVRDRIKALLEPYYWLEESDRARKWARDIAKKSEAAHMSALLQCVNAL